MTLNPRIGGFSVFLRFSAAAHISIVINNLHMKFSALNVDFSSLKLGLIHSKSFPYGNVKYGYPFKMSDICKYLFSMKTVAD